MTAQVMLGDVLVGYLDPAGDVVAFVFDAAYLAEPDRPVLGQAFEDRVLSPDQPFTGSPVTPSRRSFAMPSPKARCERSSRLTCIDPG